MFIKYDFGFPLGGGAPTYDFVKFPQKVHEIEKILDQGAPLGKVVSSPSFMSV